MPADDRAAVMAELRLYKELLGGTLDPVKVGALGYLIRNLEAKLAAMGPPSSANISSDPTTLRSGGD